MKNAKSLLMELVACYGRVAAFLDAAWQRAFGLPAMVPVAVAGLVTTENVRAAKEAERLAGVRGAARIKDEWFDGRPQPEPTPVDMEAEFEAGVAKLQGHVDRVYAHVMVTNPAEMMDLVDSVTSQWEDDRDALERANLTQILNSSGQMKVLAAKDFVNSLAVLGMTGVIRRFREARKNGGAK